MVAYVYTQPVDENEYWAEAQWLSIVAGFLSQLQHI